MRTDATGVDPEQVVVFETVGSVSDFQNVVKRISGLEWLGDFDTDIATPDPGFLADGSSNEAVGGRLFVVVGTRRAYAEILRLWRAWVKSPTEKLRRNYGALADVFKQLQDVREWSPTDRIQATGVVAYWEAGLASNAPNIRFEAELWCRTDADARALAYRRLDAIIRGSGGQCVSQATIPDIDYHGVLVELPAAAVRAAVESIRANAVADLLRITDVKYFSPLANVASTLPVASAPGSLNAKPLPDAAPTAALLDGIPLTNHLVLQGRVTVDDPDGFSAGYQALERRHGTAMASLIVHGELDAAESAITSVLYVRPVMKPGSPDVNGVRWESLPDDMLAVDLIHRAVRRIFEGEDGGGGVAPTVRVINLSLGDTMQPFDRVLSPWARLLDWLAWRYRVLFVVSTGNHLLSLTLPVPPVAVGALSDEDIRAHTLRAIVHQRGLRRLLAPSESVNALTVGALHAQTGAIGATGRLVDLLRGAALPSPTGPVGSGFRRSVKPEILVPGGTRHYEPVLGQSTPQTAEFKLSNAVNQPGQQVAFPGGTSVPPDHVIRTSGSSNATALTTRQALKFIDELRALRGEPGGEALTEAYVPVLAKAMLVHGADWGDWERFLDEVFDGPDSGNERWWRIKKACAQLLGYGAADFQRGSVCTDQRAIILGCGELRAEEGHAYKVPLPASLSAQRIRRRLSITLAWLTPVSPRHRNYCRADLWFDPPTSPLRVRRVNVDDKMVKQGTVQHEILEGDAAVPISPGDSLDIQVNCRADASGALEAGIPYALVVSLETAAPLAVSVYDQVKVALEQLRVPVPVRASGVTATAGAAARR